MEKFTTLTGVAAPLDAANVDTDQIIPKQFLLAVDRKGFGVHLFHERRYLDDAETIENPDFVLNKPEYAGKGQILVAGPEFGIGSSREHAPLAIKTAGISVVIAKSFARIFYRNSINIGLPIMECPEAVDAIHAGDNVTVDFDTGVITDVTTGKVFQAEPFPPFIQKIIADGGLMKSLTKK